MSPLHLHYKFHHCHEFPENSPHGWGTAFMHFTRKWNDIPGQVAVSDIPSQKTFWTLELEKCEAMLQLAIDSKNPKEMDRWFESLRVVQLRFEQEV